MTVSSSQAVGSVSQGSFTPSAEPVVTSGLVAEPKVTEVTSQNESNAQNKERQEGEASKEAIKQAVAGINRHANGTEAVFGYHEDTKRITIKIVDKETKDTIKEFPAEETLDLIAKAWEMAGLMVDERR